MKPASAGRHSRPPDAHHEVAVWVVEDDPEYRKGIQRLLNRAAGISCPQVFASAEGVLETLKQTPPPQLILMDLGLPGMSGIEGLRRVKQISPSTPMIILTVFDNEAKVFDAICAGASGYILKTASGQEIIQGIRSVLGGGASMSATIARRVLEMFPRLNPPKGEYRITEREEEILRLLVGGLGTKEIADRLSVSYYTIDTHLKNIYTKLHVHSGTAAVSKALREHLL